MNDDYEDDGYESGPFCEHWGDPSDCDECRALCVCGHALRDHKEQHGDKPRPCEGVGCKCEAFAPLPREGGE